MIADSLRKTCLQVFAFFCVWFLRFPFPLKINWWYAVYVARDRDRTTADFNNIMSCKKMVCLNEFVECAPTEIYALCSFSRHRLSFIWRETLSKMVLNGTIHFAFWTWLKRVMSHFKINLLVIFPTAKTYAKNATKMPCSNVVRQFSFVHSLVCK